MFGTIRKHQQWLWVIIIVLMSIGLIVFFSPDASFLGHGQQRESELTGSMNGKPIPIEGFMSARREALIAHYLGNNLTWPNSDEQGNRAIENQTISRYFLIQKIKEMGLAPSDKAVALQMRQQIGDMPLDELVKTHLGQKGLTAADYERFVRTEVGRAQLMSVAGISGKFVQPAEAEAMYRKEHQETVVQLALFWASNYLDKVAITNEAIGTHYSNNVLRYRVPERTILSYVEFANTNFYADAEKELGAITNLDVQLNERYLQRNTNDPFFLDDKGAPLAEADAKKKIRDATREDRARTAARRAANEFGTTLIEPKSNPQLDPNANNVANLEKLAALKGLSVKTSQPFDALSGLEEFDPPTNHIFASSDDDSFRAAVRRAAGELKEANPIRFNPLLGPHGVFIIARKGIVPAETPPLEKISEKVTNDFKMAVAQTLARTACSVFGTNLTNGLAAGKSFEEICKAEGVKPVDVPPFSDATQSLTNFDARINLGMLQRLTRDLEVGKAIPTIPFSMEGSLSLYVKARPKLDDAKVQAGLPDYLNQMRLYRQFEAFNQWFMKQATDARLAGPKRTNEMAGAQN